MNTGIHTCIHVYIFTPSGDNGFGWCIVFCGGIWKKIISFYVGMYVDTGIYLLLGMLQWANRVSLCGYTYKYSNATETCQLSCIKMQECRQKIVQFCTDLKWIEKSKNWVLYVEYINTYLYVHK